MDLEEFVKKNPWAFADVIPVLWDATKYKGKIYGIPQDSEIRMFFYNKDMLRKIGKDEAFIEGLPAQVEKGEFTMADLSNLTKEVIDKGAAQMGILHRPNRRSRLPDDVRVLRREIRRSGLGPADAAESGDPKRRSNGSPSNAANGVTPKNNTAMSWDEIQGAFKTEKAFIYHQGVWAVTEWMVGDAKGATWPNDRKWFFNKIGWMHAPAAVKGGQPSNLSHPIVYIVNPKSKNADLAAMLVAYATLPYYNTKHAVTTAHTAIPNGQRSMPDYANAWYLRGRDADAGALHLHPEPSRFRPLQRHPVQGAAGRRDRPPDAGAGHRLPRGRDDQRAQGQRQGRREAELRPDDPGGGARPATDPGTMASTATQRTACSTGSCSWGRRASAVPVLPRCR